MKSLFSIDDDDVEVSEEEVAEMAAFDAAVHGSATHAPLLHLDADDADGKDKNDQAMVVVVPSLDGSPAAAALHRSSSAHPPTKSSTDKKQPATFSSVKRSAALPATMGRKRACVRLTKSATVHHDEADDNTETARSAADCIPTPGCFPSSSSSSSSSSAAGQALPPRMPLQSGFPVISGLPISKTVVHRSTGWSTATFKLDSIMPRGHGTTNPAASLQRQAAMPEPRDTTPSSLWEQDVASAARASPIAFQKPGNTWSAQAFVSTPVKQPQQQLGLSGLLSAAAPATTVQPSGLLWSPSLSTFSSAVSRAPRQPKPPAPMLGDLMPTDAADDQQTEQEETLHVVARHRFGGSLPAAHEAAPTHPRPNHEPGHEAGLQSPQLAPQLGLLLPPSPATSAFSPQRKATVPQTSTGPTSRAWAPGFAFGQAAGLHSFPPLGDSAMPSGQGQTTTTPRTTSRPTGLRSATAQPLHVSMTMGANRGIVTPDVPPSTSSRPTSTRH